MRYYIAPFGRDCLGNVSGYDVRDGACAGHVVKRLVADLYVAGDHARARAAAQTECDAFNSDQQEG